MTWKIEWDDSALKELRRLGHSAQQEILRYLRERIAGDEDPRRFGKPLSGELANLWRYRVRDYRVICAIEDKEVVVLIVRVGHRKAVYR